MTTLKIVSFNILAPCWADPNIYPQESLPFLNRISRRDTIINFLLSTSADIIALQEVTLIEFGFIKDKLDLYQGFQSFHSPSHWSKYITSNPPYEQNGNAIFLKKSVFKNIKFTDVLLDGANGNHAAVLLVDHKETNKNMRLLSVHLDSDHAYNRKIQLDAILKLIPKNAGCVDIICGDFNIDVTKSNLQQDIIKANFITGFDNLGPTSPYLGKYYSNSVYGPIDAILVRNCVVSNAGIYNFGIFELYPNKKDEVNRIIEGLKKCGSDHFPVSSVVTF